MGINFGRREREAKVMGVIVGRGNTWIKHKVRDSMAGPEEDVYYESTGCLLGEWKEIRLMRLARGNDEEPSGP